MDGEKILVASLSQASIQDSHGNRWQYLSRSDNHSKLAVWGVLYDLLDQSRILREHAEAGSVVFGVNHSMRDYRTNRPKKLDLVVGPPRTNGETKRRWRTFAELGEHFGVALDDFQRKKLTTLPDLDEGVIGAVRVALEAKACMTAHTKALPRLFDELNSSHTIIHGASDPALACGHVIANHYERFLSADRNRRVLSSLAEATVSANEARGAAKVIAKVQELPRRLRQGEQGFDAIAVTTLAMANDGSPVRLVTEPPAVSKSDVHHYDRMIERMVQLYEDRFGH